MTIRSTTRLPCSICPADAADFLAGNALLPSLFDWRRSATRRLKHMANNSGTKRCLPGWSARQPVGLPHSQRPIKAGPPGAGHAAPTVSYSGCPDTRVRTDSCNPTSEPRHGYSRRRSATSGREHVAARPGPHPTCRLPKVGSGELRSRPAVYPCCQSASPLPPISATFGHSSRSDAVWSSPLSTKRSLMQALVYHGPKSDSVDEVPDAARRPR